MLLLSTVSDFPLCKYSSTVLALPGNVFGIIRKITDNTNVVKQTKIAKESNIKDVAPFLG